jgi:hypothetical protein
MEASMLTLRGGGKELTVRLDDDGQVVVRIGNGKKSMGYQLSPDERQELIDYLEDEDERDD